MPHSSFGSRARLGGRETGGLEHPLLETRGSEVPKQHLGNFFPLHVAVHTQGEG